MTWNSNWVILILCTILRQTIETSDVTGGGAELFLYQSGYLTIKDYQMGVYILGIP